MKNMTQFRFIYFFIFIFIAILKGLYYEQVYGIEKKLEEMNNENRGIVLDRKT